MQTQCICIIMTILESSSLMFTTSIQVYNTMSFVFVHRSRWHTLCFQVHWSSRVAGPAERPGIHKVHGLPSPAPTLESALVKLWSYKWAPLQHPSVFRTKRSTPGGRVNTKSSPLYPLYDLWELPALKMLMSLVNSVANSRKMTIIDGKTMFLC